MQHEEWTRYLEISNGVLWRAIRAAFKRPAVEGFYITDLLRMEPRERAEIGRGDWVVRLHRDPMPEVWSKKDTDYAFLYIEADDAAMLLEGMEKLTAEKRGAGTGGIYDRLIEEFPQFRK